MTTTSPSFTVDLEPDPEGDPGAAFHLPNGPGETQREHIYDILKSDLILQGNLLNVIHGSWSPGDGVPATLIIAEFHFLAHGSGKKSRHFREAVLNWEFSQQNFDNRQRPEVKSISPLGHISYNVSHSKEEKAENSRIDAELGTNRAPAMKLHAGRDWKVTESTEMQYRATVIGSIRASGNSPLPSLKDTVRWSLAENESQGDGLPSYLRVAILLKRKNNSQFQVAVSVHSKVDVLYSLSNSILKPFSGRKIDPIIFDPTLEPLGETPGGVSVDPGNLSATLDSMKQLCALRDTTIATQTTETTEFPKR